MKLLFTGDILIYESQDRGSLAQDGSRDYKPIFAQVKPLLDEADYVVGSFETTLAGEKAIYTHAAYSFNTPDELLPALKWAGFDMLTTANNHCFDRGFEGHARTIEMLEKNGLDYTGTRLSNDASRYLVKDFDGTKVAFVAYTYGTNSDANGVFMPEGKEYLVNLTRQQDSIIHRPLWKRVVKALLSRLRKNKNTSGIIGDCVSASEINSGRNTAYELAMIETIRKAKQEADIVIMCLHSGGQFNSKVEEYTQHLFDIIADAGADAIVCNHAHTTLPIYQHKNCLIASALGNFSFAPGEGYWVDGVKADYSALLTLDIFGQKIAGHKVDICKSVRNENGVAITIPVDFLEEKDAILERLNKKCSI